MPEHRHKLAKGFAWGGATASYQTEGAYNEDGRAFSTWDVFTRKPGTIVDGSNGDVATNSYHLWRQDIALLRSHGANAYRLSIAWPRIIPLGGRHDEVNPKGVTFYRNFLQELVDQGITPYVTLFHWDLPQALDDRYGGWLNKDEIVKDFVNFCKVCFEHFGDLVKHWFTFNEPFVYSVNSYGTGIHAPGYESSTKPYIVGHNLLIAHAYAVKLYREEFQHRQKGALGIVLDTFWFIPYTDTPEDIQSAQRAMDFRLGWFADPIYFGDYPKVMKEQVGCHLPEFTPEEIRVVKGSSDFFGLNHYTSYLTTPGGDDPFSGYVKQTHTRPDGTQLGKQGDMEWLQTYGPGFRKLLCYIHETYNGAPIIVGECGFAVKDESFMPIKEALNDVDREEYYREYTHAMLEAVVKDGVNLKGFLVWSLLDNFEWAQGYRPRFGMSYVDYSTQKRYPKNSFKFLQKWFSEHIERDE